MKNKVGRILILVGIGIVTLTALGQASAAPPVSLQLTDTIERHGITWKFSEKVRVGRFVNGDNYAVGPVTIVSITPAPTPNRNGSVLNLPPNQGESGFDDRVVGGRWNPKLRAALPIKLKPNDILISSISVEKMDELPAPLRPADKAGSPVRTVSVLTCLAEPRRRMPSARRTAITMSRNCIRAQIAPGVVTAVAAHRYPAADGNERTVHARRVGAAVRAALAGHLFFWIRRGD